MISFNSNIDYILTNNQDAILCKQTLEKEYKYISLNNKLEQVTR